MNQSNSKPAKAKTTEERAQEFAVLQAQWLRAVAISILGIAVIALALVLFS